MNRFKTMVAVLAAVLIVGSIFAPVSQTQANAEECVPSEAYTETVVLVPGVPAWDETVVVSESYDETVFDHWQRYSWTGGPHAEDTAPGFPSADWQPNVQGDPHGVGVEGAYFRSNGNSGRGDWFYLEAVTIVVHHPEVTEVIHHEAVPEVTDTVEHEAVTCDDPTEPVDPDRPNPSHGPLPDIDKPNDGGKHFDIKPQGIGTPSTLVLDPTCSGQTLVIKHIENGNVVETEYLNGHPKCAIVNGARVAEEEGM